MCMCACVGARARVRGCARARVCVCVRTWVRARACVCVCGPLPFNKTRGGCEQNENLSRVMARVNETYVTMWSFIPTSDSH